MGEGREVTRHRTCGRHRCLVPPDRLSALGDMGAPCLAWALGQPRGVPQGAPGLRGTAASFPDTDPGDHPDTLPELPQCPWKWSTVRGQCPRVRDIARRQRYGKTGKDELRSCERLPPFPVSQPRATQSCIKYRAAPGQNCTAPGRGRGQESWERSDRRKNIHEGPGCQRPEPDTAAEGSPGRRGDAALGLPPAPHS